MTTTEKIPENAVGFWDDDGNLRIAPPTDKHYEMLASYAHTIWNGYEWVPHIKGLQLVPKAEPQ
jgi:hypothetical protein